MFFRGCIKNSPRGLVNTIASCRTSAAYWDLIYAAGLGTGRAMGRAQPSLQVLGVPGESQAPPRSKPSLWDSEGLVQCVFWPSGAPWGTRLALPRPGTTVFPYVAFSSLHFATIKLAVDPRSSFDHFLPGERKAFTALEYYTDRYSIPHPRGGMENEAGSFLVNDSSLLSR